MRFAFLALALLFVASQAHAQFISPYPEIRKAVLQLQGPMVARARNPYRVVRSGYWQWHPVYWRYTPYREWRLVPEMTWRQSRAVGRIFFPVHRSMECPR